MRSYEKSWPEGFNATLSEEVATMAVTRKVLRVGTTAVCDVNLLEGNRNATISRHQAQ